MRRPTYNPSWSDEVKRVYEHDLREIWDPTIAPHIWNQYHNQLDTYFGYINHRVPLDILDVGCAQGTLALLLAERGHRVVAVDIRSGFLDYAQTRYTHGDIEFLQGNVLTMEIDRVFDTIFANQIVEHLVYPQELVARLKKLLKPDGMLIMATPNGHYLMNDLPSYKALGNPQEWEDRQFTADSDGHFYAYLATELVTVFEAVGMTEVSVQFFETPWVSGHMKFRYLHGHLSGPVLQRLDHLTLKTPWISHLFAHQLLITGISRNQTT